MKQIAILIIGAFFVALLQMGLTTTASVELVWLVAVGLLLADFEIRAIIFAIFAGSLFDIMIHGNVGVTGLGILVGFFIFILVKSLGLTKEIWQKIIVSILLFVISFGVDALLHLLLEGSQISADFLGYWLKTSLGHGLASVVVYGLILLTQNRYTQGPSVKL